MGNVYTIRSTNGETTIPIIPGQADGYSGYAQNTDLKLHGLGYLNWGAGVNENLLRITENFSSPEKELGDYNPLTGINNYNPSDTVIMPKDWHDLGHGLGINDPIEGQLWYNTTQKKLFIYVNVTASQFRWMPVNNTTNFDTSAPLNPSLGDLWFDTDNSNPSSCVSTPILKIYNPSHPSAALDNGWVTVIDDAVKKCGDTMTGDLKISKSSDNVKLTLNTTTPFQRSFYFSTNDLARWAITSNFNAETGANEGSDFIISRFDDAGAVIAGHPIQIKRADGKVILNGNPIEPLHAATKQYVDAEILNSDVDTGVIPGTYNVVTVNAKGKITSAANATNEFLPSGTRLLFHQPSAPTGWVQDVSDNANNRMLRVVNTAGGGIGGTHSPILNNVVPAHTHAFTTGNVSADHTHLDIGHTHTVGTTTYQGSLNNSGVAVPSGSAANTGLGYANLSGATSNHTHSGSTDNGSSQTNWEPRYANIIICTKV
jgi:hypothetical protein